MADVYREKVKNLCGALEAEESRTGAADAIRALVEAIMLEPDGDELKITLKGDLAGMLSAARDSKRSARYRRPPGPNEDGCGGVQPPVLAVVERGGVRRSDDFSPRPRVNELSQMPDVRRGHDQFVALLGQQRALGGQNHVAIQCLVVRGLPARAADPCQMLGRF